MFNESYFLSTKYLNEKVLIYNSESIEKCKESGAVIGFIHYGSFFLSGCALIEQLCCEFTLIASLANQVGRNKTIWSSFHRRYNKFYTSNIILNTDYLGKYVELLKSNYFIGVALDVHVKRKLKNIKKIPFMDYHVFFDDYISTISQKYGKPVIACNIYFDSKEQLHKLYLSDPIPPNPYQAERIMSFIQNYTFCESQYFHNLKKIFSSTSKFR
jgi:lauroyl/myristoyl acyltransferase